MKQTEPERISVDVGFMEEIAVKAAQVLNAKELEHLRYIFETFSWLSAALQTSRISMKKLKALFFGPKSEKTKDVLGKGKKNDEDKGASASDGDEDKKKKAKKKKKKKRKGHGRTPASAYTGAEKVHVCSDSIKQGQTCPECGKGKLYSLTPKVIVNVTGQPPLKATVYTADRWRCNLCLKIFAEKLPPEAKTRKYDEESVSTIALLKYGSGLPFNRIADLQASYGVPLPKSTQWDLINAAAIPLRPAFEELVRQAAQGDVIHNDDTNMRILSLIGPIDGLDVDTSRPSGRTGTFTTGIVSVTGTRTIGLFFTGWPHAGENLNSVLAKRDTELGAVIQMCDALSRNVPAEFTTILGNCLSHGRREFVPLADNFPDEVRYVLEALRMVYKVDAEAKRKQLTPAKRLILHQEESGPIMKGLKHWLDQQIDDKIVEPNSSLGDAIQYMRNHWAKLTLFLRQEGAPLDNNICERALKKAILHRKNALFYRTEHGAEVGDLFMSLIYTAKLANVSPFHYLTELQKHADDVARAPEDWMPWNYLRTLAADAGENEATHAAAS